MDQLDDINDNKSMLYQNGVFYCTANWSDSIDK